jgi:hypothetical protein
MGNLNPIPYEEFLGKLPKIISSKAEFDKVIKLVRDHELFRHLHGNTVRAFFRGQENEAWELKPKIARYNKRIEEVKIIEKNMVSEFSEKMKKSGLHDSLQEGFNGRYKFHTEWLLHEQAQHLGLSTRFMDWTLKPEVALFFSVRGLLETTGKVYFLFPQPDWFVADREQDDYGTHDPLDFTDDICMNPSQWADDNYKKRIAERFKSRQHGRFLVQSIENSNICLTKQDKFAPVICGVNIDKDSKKKILSELSDEGFTEEFLFMQDEREVAEIMPEIDKIIKELHVKYKLS